MRVCIVSGIFEPEAGGPATYAPRLAAALTKLGDDVTVVTYSAASSAPGDLSYPFRLVRVRRGNKLLNRIRYFFAVLPHVRRADAVYLLDWFAAGLPASLAARLLRKPYIVRVGGDYLWEQRYLESGRTPVPLSDFYAKGMHEEKGYLPYFRAIRGVLMKARRIVFNAENMRDLYVRYYGLPRESTAVIHNPVPRAETGGIVRGEPTKEIVYWGRFIVMKNIDSLVRAFAKARLPEGYTLALIGDGPQKGAIEQLVAELGLAGRISLHSAMPPRQVLERVRNARAFVLPSWTDISPNQVYEAMAIGLPGLVTDENYLSIRPALPQRIDPRSADDIASKLEMLADDARYAAFARDFRAISFEHSWDDAAREHHELFSDL